MKKRQREREREKQKKREICVCNLRVSEREKERQTETERRVVKGRDLHLSDSSQVNGDPFKLLSFVFFFCGM